MTVHNPPVDKPRVRSRLQEVHLRIDRSGQTNIIIVKKTDVLSSACQDANVSSPARSAATSSANIVNVAQTLTRHCGPIGRSIVDDNDLNIVTCQARAVYCAREKRASITSRDDYTHSCHTT